MKSLFVSIVAAFSLAPSASALDIELVPRISAGAAYYKAEDYLKGVDPNAQGWYTQEATYLFGGGLNLYGNRWTIDAGIEMLPITFKNDQFPHEEKAWKTEVALTAGWEVRKSVYLLGGYRYGLIGEEIFKDTTTQSGPFLGIGISQLSIGQSGQDIFGFTFSMQMANVKDTSGEAYGVTIDDDSIGVNMGFSYRPAGTPHSIKLKFQQITSEKDKVLNENQFSLVYSVTLGSLF